MVREQHPLLEAPISMTFPYFGLCAERCYYKCFSCCTSHEQEDDEYLVHQWWEQQIEEIELKNATPTARGPPNEIEEEAAGEISQLVSSDSIESVIK